MSAPTFATRTPGRRGSFTIRGIVATAVDFLAHEAVGTRHQDTANVSLRDPEGISRHHDAHPSSEPSAARVLILLENLPLQRDAHVKRQCRALIDHGYGVTVVCPRSGEPIADDLRAVRLRTWKAPAEGSGRLHYVREYAVALVMSAFLVLRAATREGFDAIQACNPPDFYFLIAAPFRLAGKPFVFDHHDLTPELFAARFGGDSGMLAASLRAMERATFASSDHVIATNESVRRIAMERGAKHPSDVTVVRNGPLLADTLDRAGDPALRRGRDHLICWHGVMGSADDGLDLAVRAIADLVHGRGDLAGRDDCHFVFLGDGEARPSIEALVRDLRLEDVVSFPGWSSMDVVHDHLATATLGLVPDPKSPGVDKATVMKVMEYMAFGVPIVAFDVVETRVSAGDAGAYASHNDPHHFARLVDALLDDPTTRATMGRTARQRIQDGLAWDHQRPRYLAVFDRLLAHESPNAARPPAIAVGSSCRPPTRVPGLTSVIVPTHHRPETLRQTLVSVLAQQDVRIEVVVVDDGPDVRTYGVVEQLADPRVRVVDGADAGSAAATRNVGLRHARGEWIALCDDDDLWAPDKLQAQHTALRETGATWSCTGVVRVDANLRPIGHDRVDQRQFSVLDRFNVVPGGGSAMMASAASFDAAGGFDETLTNAEDWDMWIRIGRQGPGAAVDRPLVAYREWSANKSSDLDGVTRSVRRILEQHGHWPPDDAAATMWDRFFMTRLSGSSHRRDAALLTLRIAWRTRRPKSVARAAALMVAPEQVAQRDRQHRLDAIPADWILQTSRWMDGVLGPRGRAESSSLLVGA